MSKEGLICSRIKGSNHFTQNSKHAISKVNSERQQVSDQQLLSFSSRYSLHELLPSTNDRSISLRNSIIDHVHLALLSITECPVVFLLSLRKGLTLVQRALISKVNFMFHRDMGYCSTLVPEKPGKSSTSEHIHCPCTSQAPRLHSYVCLYLSCQRCWPGLCPRTQRAKEQKKKKKKGRHTLEGNGRANLQPANNWD